MVKPKYRKILLKLSGESLLPPGERFGVDKVKAGWIAAEVKSLIDKKISVAIVIGGGNIFRGVKAETDGMDRVRADTVGMLSTVINGLVLLEGFEKAGIDAELLSAREVSLAAKLYEPHLGRKLWENGKTLILVGGTGNPYFSTDTAASLRAVELGAEVILKGTKVDGIYDCDPKSNPRAKLFEKLTFSEVLSRNLKVMDSTAVSMCRDNNIPIIVFNLMGEGNLFEAVMGKRGTTVYGDKDIR